EDILVVHLPLLCVILSPFSPEDHRSLGCSPDAAKAMSACSALVARHYFSLDWSRPIGIHIGAMLETPHWVSLCSPSWTLSWSPCWTPYLGATSAGTFPVRCFLFLSGLPVTGFRVPGQFSNTPLSLCMSNGLLGITVGSYWSVPTSQA